MTEAIIAELEDNLIYSAIIPHNCTKKLQLMDISVNKVIKSLLRLKFFEWYSDELTENLLMGMMMSRLTYHPHR